MAVPIQTTIAVGWQLAAITILLTSIRYALRHFVIRFWYWDDLFQGINLIILIASMAEITATVPILAEASDKSDHRPIDEKYRGTLQISASITILGLSTYWITKITFLMFYRLLFQKYKGFMRAWWVIFVVTVITYWIVLAKQLTKCGGSAAHYLQQSVCSEPEAAHQLQVNLIMNYCFNVATDLAIMILPLSFLHTLQLSFRRKLGVGAIFSLGLVIIVFETLRLAESQNPTSSSNNTLWGVMETSICVIVSALPVLSAFRIWKRNGYRTSPQSYGHVLRSRRVQRAPDGSNAAPSGPSESRGDDSLKPKGNKTQSTAVVSDNAV